MPYPRIPVGLAVLSLCAATVNAAPADQAMERANARSAVLQHWSAERMQAAQPRDLVIDERGLGYLKLRNDRLVPYGHDVAALAGAPESRAKPGSSGGDTTPPAISNMSPAAGATIGADATFSATVTDASGLRSVSIEVATSTGAWQSFAASAAGDTWSVSLSGFTDGEWRWRVVAQDTAKRGGNTATSEAVAFTVDTGSGGGGGGDNGGGTGNIIENSRWTGGGTIQTAAGRIFFEMPQLRGKRISGWNGYVCSGTLVNDSAADRSILVTAAHCVYDDVAKKFARNVLFIPNQDQTTGAGTDTNCDNDPLGCWVADFGVVDTNWTAFSFPDNIPWDYAFYVLSDNARGGATGLLEDTVAPMGISFDAPATGTYTWALGYSYSDDPFFMHCAEDMGLEGSANWWLPSRGLSGGSSGGPWTQNDPSTGNGPVMSVNSWGYTTGPGMAGPFLNGTSAQCLFNVAQTQQPASFADGEAGIVPAACQ